MGECEEVLRGKKRRRRGLDRGDRTSASSLTHDCPRNVHSVADAARAGTAILTDRIMRDRSRWGRRALRSLSVHETHSQCHADGRESRSSDPSRSSGSAPSSASPELSQRAAVCRECKARSHASTVASVATAGLADCVARRQSAPESGLRPCDSLRHADVALDSTRAPTSPSARLHRLETLQRLTRRACPRHRHRIDRRRPPTSISTSADRSRFDER